MNIINQYFARIDKKLDIIMSMLKSSPASNHSLSSLDTEFLNKFPINDIDTLKRLDDMFKNDEVHMAKLVTIIGCVKCDC